MEIQIRTGYAYNSIYELRQGLSLQSFWSQHITQQLQSQTKKTKGQASLQAVNAQVRDAMRTYNVCWRWLTKVSGETAVKFGLRQLSESDIFTLSDWQEGRGYKHSNKRLLWFWTLRPQSPALLEEDPPGTDDPPSRLEQVIEAWRSECMPVTICMRFYLGILIWNRRLVVRLDFVHSTASVERWVEEVAIIGREMAATCRSFQHKAMVWSERASQAFKDSGNGSSPWEMQPQELRGCLAYASRQFDLYTWLADSSYEEFQAAVGQENWTEIWKGPNTLERQES